MLISPKCVVDLRFERIACDLLSLHYVNYLSDRVICGNFFDVLDLLLLRCRFVRSACLGVVDNSYVGFWILLEHIQSD